MKFPKLVARMSFIFLLLGIAASVWADEKSKSSSNEPISTGVDFARDVQPILKKSCWKCHGAEKQKSDFRLDVRDSAFRHGELSAPNIVPKKSEESPLIRYVTGKGDLVMPPDGERLTSSEVDLLKRWIDQGAEWPDELAGELKKKDDLWSFRPLSRPKVPEGTSPKGVLDSASPIDSFIRSKLTSKGLRLAPRADRRTLIRRVYFDLIGLPPSPEEVELFISDPDENAYEKLIDRLLMSPHYGERWARHWIDAAHFAETHGHDQDRIRENAWPYRDYLIDSLNTDKPYGAFVQEQIAGDVLFPNDPQATVALAFLAAGPWDESSLQSIREDTLDRQIARYIDRDDMLATIFNNICGMTVQCARCHDHKFDPITQRDYYQLQAVFSGVERANRKYYSDPKVTLRRNELLRKRLELEKPSPETNRSLLGESIEREVIAWEKRIKSNVSNWRALDPKELHSSDGATLTRLADYSILSEGVTPEKDTVTLHVEISEEAITASDRDQLESGEDAGSITGLRLEVLADERLPGRGPGRQPSNGNLHLSEIEVYRNESDSMVEIARAVADFDQQGWEISKAIDKNDVTAWGIHPKEGESHSALFEFKTPLRLDRSLKPKTDLSKETRSDKTGLQLKIVLKQLHGRQHIIGRFRLSVTNSKNPLTFEMVPDRIASILAIPREQRSETQRLELAIYQQMESIRQELISLPSASLIYAAAAEFEPDGGLVPPPGPRAVHVLHRGDIRYPREEVFPGGLKALKAVPSDFSIEKGRPESVRRAALARWITHQENPLTWRSIVNRVWHHHFGRGLVATVNDLGRMGELPSHPDLLDWLAIEFRDGGQRLKSLHRMILTTDTYCQSSLSADADPQSVTVGTSTDADNRLLWRMNRIRLDAECVRDAVLAISGSLDTRMGGRSDRQFELQPGVHVTPKIDYSKFDHGSSLAQRRSIYRFLFRTLPDPFMESLDCPSGDQITPSRVNSVTVQQALALWNDRFITHHCERIASRIEERFVSEKWQSNENALNIKRKVDQAFRLILNRPIETEEEPRVIDFASRHGLANVCRLLINSNEFLFVD